MSVRLALLAILTAVALAPAGWVAPFGRPAASAPAVALAAEVTTEVAPGVTPGLAPGVAPGAAAEVPDALAIQPRQPGVELFYFFSPDWRPPDLGKLAIAVEKAFAAGHVNVSFQAFTRYEDFARQVLVQPPVFMIAPAWIEGPGGAALGLDLRVIARPQRRGKSTYRKALMTRANIDSIDDLARGAIAATLHSMGSGNPAAVLDAFHLAAESARVVPVPKDVDALLALNFGQVDAALVTSEQYEQLARTNPAEAERLRVLAFSSEVGLPPVFASSAADPAERDRLSDLLARLREVPEGTDVLTMLGFDGFVAEVPVAAGQRGSDAPAGAEAGSTAAGGGAAASMPGPPAVANDAPPVDKKEGSAPSRRP